jgi:ketosteroid isomerase-like protein
VTEANVATLRAGYEALNRGDLSEVMGLIDDDITFDPGPLSPDSDSGARGREGFRALVQSWLDAFDEFRIEPLEVTEQADKLIASVRQSGRGRGSGVEIAVEIAHVWTVRDGQAIRLESFPNVASALEALTAD